MFSHPFQLGLLMTGKIFIDGYGLEICEMAAVGVTI